MRFIPYLKGDHPQPLSAGFEIPVDITIEEVKAKLEKDGVLNPFYGIDEDAQAVGFLAAWDSTTQQQEMLLGILSR